MEVAIATQARTKELLKEWVAAEDMETAIKAAAAAAEEYDGLYEDSAKNFLAREPQMMMLLSSFLAGRQYGVGEEAAKHKPVQETLDA